MIGGFLMKRTLTSLLLITFLIFPIGTAEAVPIKSLRDSIEPSYSIQEEKEFTKYITETLTQVQDLGLKEDVFSNLEIYILPCEYLNVIYSTGEVKGEAVTISKPKENKIEIHITMGNSRAKHSFLHELGHVFEDNILSATGYNWAEVNSAGKLYKYLRNYENDMSGKEQLQLPWHERISEWWAEDVKEYLYYKIYPDEKYKNLKNIELENLSELDLFFDVILLK